MAIEDKIRVTEQNVIAVGGGIQGPIRVSDIHAIAIGGQTAPYIFVHNADSVVVGTDEGKATVLRVHEQHVIVVGALGVLPEGPLAVSVFPYDIDGHVMYGLHIRGRGTFIYDDMTSQWSEWRTADFPFWNAQYHVKWNDQYYASTMFENQLNLINPDSVLDDSFRTNDFIATGRLESQDRGYVANPEAQIFGSIGLRGGEVNLRYSDDEGENWSSYLTVDMTPGVRNANVMFYDLGSVTAPGRIFQIQDEGTLRRIQSLKVMLGDV